MKKCILPIMLIISTYLLILITFKGNHKGVLANLNLIFLGISIIFFISNMIYPFILAKHGESSTALLFWDMLLKLCNIPIYIVVFMFGSIMMIWPLGFGVVIALFLALFDYIMLLPSSMYGVNGIVRAYREKKITKSTAVVNCILHFLFCLDVVSAIVMFCIVKSKRKFNEEVI
ncbi:MULTISPECIES: hypothetical protein [unclassified Clostridium]|uniref:hypothetical protein n=1 Tax=unclassified Clostridium TaxID=2614128 RepID=UPI00207A033F|nr:MULTISPECIES: hypothetical protein [unclassified Clostridium]